MRKATFGCANSVDNFIARPDGSVDWLMWSDEAAEIMKEYWPRIDTIVMGRKTWEISLAMAPKPKKKPAVKKRKTSDPYGGVRTFVMSRSLKPGEVDGGEIVGDDVVDFVRGLKQQDGKEICIMGGGELARPLLEAGLIDEVGVNIHPVLLGSGIPLFHRMDRQIDLERIDCRPMKNGCIYVLYRVKGVEAAPTQ
jgi:dihydrofolate reductase